MKGYRVTLSGSYSGNTYDLFKGMRDDGVLQFSFVGREVTLQVRGDSLEDVTKSLAKAGVKNICILEWKRMGTTVSGSGSGGDDAGLLAVSITPTAVGEGLKLMSVIQKVKVERKLYVELLANLEVILGDAGVSDALYTMQVNKEAAKDQYIEAVKAATLNAVFNAGGVASVE